MMPKVDRLKLNLVLLYAGELAGKLLGLTVFGYLGRMLTPARYGDMEFAIAILFLLNLFMEAGLAPFGAREAAKHPDRMPELAAQILLVRTGLLALAGVILVTLYGTLDRDPVARLLVLAYGLVLVPVPLLLNWAFQARDEMLVVATTNTLRQAILAGIAFVAVHGPEDVMWVPIADALGLLISVLVQQVMFRRRAGRIRPLEQLSQLGPVIRESAPIAGSSMLWALRMFLPLLSLGMFQSSAETGVFGAGHRLIVALHTFVWLYFFNLLPSISRAARPDDMGEYRRLIGASFELIAWVVLAGAAIGTAISPWLVPFIYGEGLAAATGPFTIMLWMLVAAFLSGHHRFSLIAFNDQRRELMGSVVGASVSLGLCLLLSERLTPELAATVFVSSEVATLLVSATFLRMRIGSLGLLRTAVRPAIPAAIGLFVTLQIDLGIWANAGVSALCFAVALLILGRALPERLKALRVS